LSEQVRAARNYRAQRSIQQRDFMTAARSFSPTHFHLVAVDTIEKSPAFGLNVGLGARCHRLASITHGWTEQPQCYGLEALHKGGEVELLVHSPAPLARGPAGLLVEINVHA
jgi:hypothetical protein